MPQAIPTRTPPQPQPPLKASFKLPYTQGTRLVPWLDYRGDLWHRDGMTGDWGGYRQRAMDKGLRIDVNLTQNLQGNLAGGVSNRAWYQGSLDYGIRLDTGAAGLWPGGMFVVRGMTPFGRSNNRDSGTLVPVNTDAIYPVPGQRNTELTDAYYAQFVAPWLRLVAGKMTPRLNNVFAHDETTQFMNLAFTFNPIIGTTVPLSFLTAGATLLPTDWLTITTLALDSEGTADVFGCDTAFDRHEHLPEG